ncbi:MULTISPECIES: cobalt-precorrin-5B (C(1))-methyltransferase [Halomonadaceae]|uniref:Cobalt-precorrin-5B C(1)-methyltransferase n=1 Tax=Vreelandella halophila TaxID=86177 RepID=A0A9X4YCS5_9GAMM|nr:MULTISPECIES: cobalt-precorrin-5B (C(1))-methyltransferase [Halomonas]MYL27121.1 cobalt-precorrin-5B (C(1))-methyltransferase [Halomonas utahensis]MYL74323.1 cobalt-precorrin-5B (C(1))-methyltransferase [Halomonas sp. 22501_18_FS]
MRPETPEHNGPLRQGLSTGACATAASVAAARALLAGVEERCVSIRLPRGQEPAMTIEDLAVTGVAATAGVIKDAGDDPDATHGARLWVRLELGSEPGVRFHAGEGVGTVTRSGLPIAVGEAAINPVPRRLIAEHLDSIAADTAYEGGFDVTVGIDDGEAIAQRTMNPKLGILGGLSVLGTTGIVRPFSCSAFIASIHQSVDVANANGLTHIAGCTGGTSETFARSYFGLEEGAIVEMGDMFGALLKYLKKYPLPRVTLASGFGKLSKFAAGEPDTHSQRCAIDFDFLADQALAAGAGADLAEWIRNANTSIEALEACQQAGVPLGDRMAGLGLARMRDYLPGEHHLTVCSVSRQGELTGFAEEVA